MSRAKAWLLAACAAVAVVAAFFAGRFFEGYLNHSANLARYALEATSLPGDYAPGYCLTGSTGLREFMTQTAFVIQYPSIARSCSGKSRAPTAGTRRRFRRRSTAILPMRRCGRRQRFSRCGTIPASTRGTIAKPRNRATRPRCPTGRCPRSASWAAAFTLRRMTRKAPVRVRQPVRIRLIARAAWSCPQRARCAARPESACGKPCKRCWPSCSRKPSPHP